MEFRGRVTGVAPLDTGESRQRGRWRVIIEVVKASPGTERALGGKSVSVLVHSLAHTFAADRSDIVGQEFDFVLSDAYAPDYSGELFVRTLNGTVLTVP